MAASGFIRQRRQHRYQLMYFKNISFKKIIAALFLNALLFSHDLHAQTQPAVRQVGSVTAGHSVLWNSNQTIKDGGFGSECASYGCYISSFFLQNGNGTTNGFANGTIGFSTSFDGINWQPIASNLATTNYGVGVYQDPNGIASRDPSILYYNNLFYLVYTSNASNGSFGLASSPDLINWTFLQNVSMASISPCAGFTWAPEWFTDTDGSLHIFLAARTGACTQPLLYEIHPTSFPLSASSTFSNPIAITRSNTGNIGNIDPFMVKINGTYYLFSGGQSGYIQFDKSTNLTSGYSNTDLQLLVTGYTGFMEGESVFFNAATSLYNVYFSKGSSSGYFLCTTSDPTFSSACNNLKNVNTIGDSSGSFYLATDPSEISAINTTTINNLFSQGVVNGNFDNYAYNGFFQYWSGNSNQANGYEVMSTGNGNNLIINPVGNIGIGTNSPASKFSIFGGGLAVGTYAGTANVGIGSAVFSGNVGIGTPSATAAALNVNGQIAVAAGTAGAPAYSYIGQTTTGWYLNGFEQDLSSGGTNLIRILPGGTPPSSEIFLVGGTTKLGLTSGSSASTLTVAGNAQIGTGFNGNAAPTNGLLVQGGVSIGTALPSSTLSVFGGGLAVGTYASTANSAVGIGSAVFSGNVGIGTATPISALAINGVSTYYGTAPTCGTGCASIASGSTNTRGSMVSSSSVSSVTLNFATTGIGTWSTTPFCTISDSNSTAVADISALSTTALTVSLASALTAVTIYWHCDQ